MPVNFLQSYTEAGNVIASLRKDATVGPLWIATRSRNTGAGKILLVSKHGELWVYNNDGTLDWNKDSGVSLPDEASVSDDGFALVRKGTQLTGFNSSGAQEFQITISGLRTAKISNNYAVCGVIGGTANPITGATSGIEWRDRTSGAIVTDKEGITGSPVGTLCAIAVPISGEDVMMFYQTTAISTRCEEFKRTRNQALEANPFANVALVSGEGGFGPTALFADCGSNIGKFIVGAGIPATSTTGGHAIGTYTENLFPTVDTVGIDGSHLLGWNGINVVVYMAPGQERAVAFGAGSAVSSARISFDIVTGPTFRDIDPNAAPNGVPQANNYAADVTDSFNLYVCDVTGIIHIYEDSITQATSAPAVGVVQNMVAARQQ